VTHWSMSIFVLAMLTLLQAQIHDILYPVLLALVGYVFVVCMTPLDHSTHVTMDCGIQNCSLCCRVVLGTLSEGTLSDGTLSDGTLSDGTLSDGTLSNGTLSDGTLSDGTLVVS